MLKKRSPLARLYREQRFLFLLLSLILLFVISPFLGDDFWGTTVLQMLLSFIFLSAVFAVLEDRKLTVFAIVFASITLVLLWLNYAVKNPYLMMAALAWEIGFMALTAGVMLSHVLGERKAITLDKINGALCVYFLLGFIWALIFVLVEVGCPGSFAMPDVGQVPTGEGQQSPRLFSHFAYYSFVTITTLGYGDITPVTRFARTLSALEAVIGQLYIAVMIAALVGLHIAQRRE